MPPKTMKKGRKAKVNTVAAPNMLLTDCRSERPMRMKKKKRDNQGKAMTKTKTGC